MEQLFKNAEEKMNKSVAVLQSEYAAIRAGRANPAVLDKVLVEYYGTPTPINQVAAVSVPEPRTVMIQPWDKTLLKAIEKAVLTSDIGINPQNDGSALRLNFPPLNEERRRELSKSVYKYAEDTKVAVRSIRRDLVDKLKDMKKKSEMTEDEAKASEKACQDLTDKYTKELDKVTEAKNKEIMEI